MKVAHIITRLIIGGAQENTLLTVEDQHRDYGDEVSLIVGKTEGREGSLLPRAKAGGFPVIDVPALQRSISPWRELTALRQLKQVLRELEPEIVHTHSSKAGILGRMAAGSLKIPCIHTIHGAAFHYGQSKLAYHLYRRLERWAEKKCAHTITVCDAMRDQYLAAGIGSPERYTTVYSGFDVEPFLHPAESPLETRTELGITHDQIVVGKVARLSPLKGHEELIKAAPGIVAACPNVRFLLVGDGSLRRDYERQIAEMGLRENFLFTGLVPPEEVAKYIHAMDLLVHTSHWEGLARVLPQALIAGKPVVSFHIDGAPEVVIPQETGCLVEPRDTEQLIAAVVELANDREKRERFGQTGRERFTDQFRHQTMTRRIREVYEQVLDET